ncbi:hypothetical protein CDL15_Pgr026728 [Punica granatum]|uniref:Uncharacterized protein n=1 Tax=Punica granatum TaxID=22663 RepID=A0A218WMD3_PUNGR|nr:hypothetical protein CDL15_Pgr026728 [Punica granatum]
MGRINWALWGVIVGLAAGDSQVKGVHWAALLVRKIPGSAQLRWASLGLLFRPVFLGFPFQERSGAKFARIPLFTVVHRRQRGLRRGLSNGSILRVRLDVKIRG